MEKTFDFENIGKRMPYTVPDDFFTKLEESVMDEVKVQKSEARAIPKRKKAKHHRQGAGAMKHRRPRTTR